MMNDDEEFITTPYRKKSKRRPPKKANHKHESADCIFVENKEGPDGFLAGKNHMYCGKYCPICGKIMDISSLWTKELNKDFVDCMYFSYRMRKRDGRPPSNLQKKIGPFFEIEDFFQKFVSLENKGEEE